MEPPARRPERLGGPTLFPSSGYSRFHSWSPRPPPSVCSRTDRNFDRTRRPDLSVDADCWQERAANPPKSGHFDRLVGQLDRLDPLTGLWNRWQWSWAPGCQDTFLFRHHSLTTSSAPLSHPTCLLAGPLPQDEAASVSDCSSAPFEPEFGIRNRRKSLGHRAF